MGKRLSRAVGGDHRDIGDGGNRYAIDHVDGRTLGECHDGRHAGYKKCAGLERGNPLVGCGYRLQGIAVLFLTTTSWRNVTCLSGLSMPLRMSTSSSTVRRPIIALGWAMVVSGGWK